MKSLLYLLCACLLAAPACSTKKEDPAPITTTPPTATVNAVVKNNGVIVPATVGVLEYADAIDAGGARVSRAIIYVIFTANGQPAQASVKYYLTSTSPMGTVTRLTAQPWNATDYSKPATGTLTGRLSGGKLLLSGTFAADLGPGFTGATATFTDLTQ